MDKKFSWKIAALVLVVAAILIAVPTILDRNKSGSKDDSAINKQYQTQTATISIQGLYAEKQITITPNETALEVLQSLNSIDPQMHLATKDYPGMGVLVQRIGALSNSSGNEYWQYKINGVMPQIGADQYKMKNGDKIEWFFAASQGS